jgi:tRNA dimethylallyltransferase
MSWSDALDVDAAVAELARHALGHEGQPGKLIAIVGPTASGKTELAVALGERIGGEIVSADSVQVYDRFDIGSGKPTKEELARAPHHLVGVKGAHDPVDAAGYATLARAAIDDVRSRGKHAVVCGGTFLWVKALLFGLAEAPHADEVVRARHREIAATAGRGELHRMLSAVDAKSAARLHPNDQVRVSRALEVFELTGETMSALHERHAFRDVRYEAKLVARALTPEALTVRIERRVDAWLATGWIEEVAALVSDGYAESRAMGSVGYRQVLAHVRGELPREELSVAITRATRVFARRQRTWLNHADVTWV